MVVCSGSLSGARPSQPGRPGEAHNCVIGHHDPGAMISRIDEYVNPTCQAQLGLGG